MFRKCLAYQKRFPVYRVFTPRISMFSSVSKTFLNVPFDMKDEVKQLGAKWDKDSKKWYITEEMDAAPFQKFNSPKSFLEVPFEMKDEVKSLGAKWDSDSKKWYITDEMDSAPFQKFFRVYLTVPFAEKDEVKGLGARWDKEKSQWYVSSGAAMTQFQKWANTAAQPAPMKSTPFRVSKAEPAAKTIPTSTATTIASPAYAAKSTSRSSNDGGAARATDSKQNILLLSIDTNGLPKQDNGKYLPYDDLMSYDTSRLIQISYQLCRLQDLSRISGDTFTIQSDGFPIDNSQFHNITLQMSNSNGIPFMDAAEKVFGVLQNAHFVCAHNADFVYNVLLSELFRHGMLEQIEDFEKKQKFCSMVLTEKPLGLKDKNGSSKKPSLKELVQGTTGESLPTVRNSSANVEFLRKGLQILVNTGSLTFPVKR